ncbi:hypothetical protein C804_00965 [Lachnospiraceae bacterium A4]|nr:hypothetical protein C804_00965 [Lachnospiraceae bacterium A4]
MRRRLIGNVCAGLGNPLPVIFDNEWTDNKKFNEVVKLFFEDILNSLNDETVNDIGGFDFKIELKDNSFRILFGIEPSYMYDSYICYCFDSDKEKSCIHKGQALGYYGADIKIKSNKSYKRCGKEFRECIDRHYENLMRCLNEIN